VSPAIATFLFESANFIVLATALGWLFFKPVRRALQTERERQLEATEEAKAKTLQAEQLLAEANEAKQRLNEQLEQQRKEELEQVRTQIAQQQAAAEKQQAARAAQADKELEAAHRARAKELATSVGQVAATAVRELLMQVSGPALDTALVRSACQQLSDGASSSTQALVEHAQPLSEEAQRLLRTALGQYSARQVPELGAGVRIITDTGQVDATALSFARRAAQLVSNGVMQSATNESAAIPGGAGG